MADGEKKFNILDELAKSSGYDLALMTTFNFEISFFERAVLSRFSANDVRKISVFVDAREFNKALAEVESCYIGRRYMVNPVPINASFHPKVILLLGEKKARLFIGSANIKTSGYTINNEIFNYIDYSPEKPEFLDVIVDAIDFFNEMNNVSYKLDSNLINSSKNYVYYHKVQENGKVKLLNNLYYPITTQLRELITEEIQNIKIAVPYFDNELAAYKVLENMYETADIDIYVQNEKSTFPKDYNIREGIAQNIKIFNGFINNSYGSTNFYHGKVFLFNGKEKSYILYGSSNCTQAALTKAFVDGGNIECNLLEVGGLHEFDYFFENIRLEHVEKLECNPMVHESEIVSKVIYKYGVDQNGFLLHFSKPVTSCDIEFYIEAIKLQKEIKNDEIIVVVPDELSTSLKEVFEIVIEIDGVKESCRCWTYSVSQLENNRIKMTDKKSLESFDYDYRDDDKFREDRYNLLKADMMCLSEIQEHNKKSAAYSMIKQEQEGDDSQESDFIVDIQIPDEYRADYKQFNLVSSIRNHFLKSFVRANGSILCSNHPEYSKKDDVVNEYENKQGKARKATSAEKAFERFVKTRVKGMFNNSYIELIELEHYLGIVEVVLNIFHKYNDIEKVEDIFDTNYVIRTRSNFFIEILKKIENEECPDEIWMPILEKCYKILVENYLLRNKEKEQENIDTIDSMDRLLITSMQRTFDIREKYTEHLRIITEQKMLFDDKKDFVSFCTYIEGLFGYKSLRMLSDYVNKIYEDSEINEKGNTMFIISKVEKVTDYLRPDMRVIREIANYSRVVSKIDKVVIKLCSLKPNLNAQNPIIEIDHEINMSYFIWTRITIRKNGNKEIDKPQYI